MFAPASLFVSIVVFFDYSNTAVMVDAADTCVDKLAICGTLYFSIGDILRCVVGRRSVRIHGLLLPLPLSSVQLFLGEYERRHHFRRSRSFRGHLWGRLLLCFCVASLVSSILLKHFASILDLRDKVKNKIRNVFFINFAVCD